MALSFYYPTFDTCYILQEFQALNLYRYLYKCRTWSTGIMDEIILNKKTGY